MSGEETPRAELVATENGRVVIPVQVRRAAGIEPGQRLVVYVEDGRVVIEDRGHLLTRVQDEAIAAADAVRAAQLWPATRSARLSFGDRACLAVATGIPDGVAVTADRAWGTLDLGIDVQLIR